MKRVRESDAPLIVTNDTDKPKHKVYEETKKAIEERKEVGVTVYNKDTEEIKNYTLNVSKYEMMDDVSDNFLTDKYGEDCLSYCFSYNGLDTDTGLKVSDVDTNKYGNINIGIGSYDSEEEEDSPDLVDYFCNCLTQKKG